MKITLEQNGIKWDTTYLIKGRSLIFLSLLIFFLGAFRLNAQVLSTDVWHDGFIVTEESDTLKGLIKYNMETGVVQYSDQKSINEAFTSKTLIYFQISDKLLDRTRRFFSLPYSFSGNYESMQLFEVLIEGELNLLARETREQVTKSDYYWGVFYTYGQEILKQHYFLLLKTGRITEFSGKKRDFLNFIGNRKAGEIKDYMKRKNLNTNNKRELMKIVTYYNQLY